MHCSGCDFKRFMDESGLSAPQVNSLFQLYHHGSSGVTQNSTDLGVTNAASSQLIDRLVQQGIDRVHRRPKRPARQAGFDHTSGAQSGEAWYRCLPVLAGGADDNADSKPARDDHRGIGGAHTGGASV